MLLSRTGPGPNGEQAAMMADAGWQAVDLRNITDDFRCFDHQWDAALPHLQQVINTTKQAGLEIGQCHAPFPTCYAYTTEEELEHAILCVERSVRLASEVHIPYTVIHPLVYSWEKFDPHMDHAWELNVSYLKRVCRYAEHTVVCLENMPGGFITNGEQMARILQEAGIDDLMVCLDTGHLFCMGGKTSDFFAQVGGRIRTTHIHDSIPGQDLHLLPQTGRGDWEDFKTAIKAYGYTGNLNSESDFCARMPLELRPAALELERRLFATFLE